MTDSEIIAVVQAHKDGKQIQFRVHGSEYWVEFQDPKNPKWEFNKCDFRVKPEPRKPREWNATVVNGQLFTSYTVGVGLEPTVESIRVREVIDE